MRVLVFGQTGQVATELARRAGDDVVMTCLGRNRADLSDPAACAAAIAASDADVVINAAAYTAVDRAETEEDLATTINGSAPGAMAQACAARGIPFLHISTDYVFDGSGTQPWQPDDVTGPLGGYGRSKLAGEVAVRAAGGPHAILRTSWVVSAHGANFVKTMLRLGAERDTLTIVADQIGGPTAAADIAAALLTMTRAFHAGQGTTGTYHFSGAPDVSWADFARAIFAGSGLTCMVEDIPTSAYPTPARRPANSRMDCTALTRDYGIERPDWRESLRDILADLKEN
ncbi:MAG: dTDP-4-dehydrorhamnose reductase [Paracoccaceae bacterium]|uniref:dTDP-4-dehydrorhamnose reductase n=1 Tax=Seohaeicola saemankumensis TaxID=481181 RepID=UPI001E471ECC|nr:dTDP-4-dehydrorhamnose reductase [Seohaeicola saemankumensis]MCD1627537.1 dTDP-4-dehydrorhamnose reductase [Seohaeicola saemankumensis]